jgi:hypothetical protein
MDGVDTTYMRCGEPGMSQTSAQYFGKEVRPMNEAIGLETTTEPVSNEPDTGVDVQQSGDFQGDY